MKLRLNINGGSMEDIVVLQNILNNYDVRVDVIPSISYGNELGAEFIPAKCYTASYKNIYRSKKTIRYKTCYRISKWREKNTYHK